MNEHRATVDVDELEELIAAAHSSERAAERKAMLLTVIPLVVGAVWLTISFYKVNEAERRARTLDIQASKLQKRISTLEKNSTELLDRVGQLRESEKSLLDFLARVTASENIRLVDPTIDWEKTKMAIVNMEAGQRKSAVLAAILLAWKDLPFSIENAGLASGVDSPHFINLVLRTVGVEVHARPGQRLSDAMMRAFPRVESPLPGDLIFYRGNVGSFVVMYIAPGSRNGHGVAVGTLQTGEEVQILDTANINTPAYPLIGIFRVPYDSLGKSPAARLQD